MVFEICMQFQHLSWSFPTTVVKFSSEGHWVSWPVLLGHNKTQEERSNQSVSSMLCWELQGFCTTSGRSIYSTLLSGNTHGAWKNTDPSGAASPNTSSCCPPVLLLPHFSALREPWQLWAALAMETAASRTWCEPPLPGLQSHTAAASKAVTQTGAVSPQANNKMRIQWSSHNQDQMQKRPVIKALPSH